MNEFTTVAELTAEDVTPTIDCLQFGFSSTDELEPLDTIVGQPRSLRALDLGLGLRHRNHHIYVSGLTGTGRLDLVHDAVQERTQNSAPPQDWAYVHNFQESDRPIVIALPAGLGGRLKTATTKFVDDLREALPRAFRQEDFSDEKGKLRKRYMAHEQELLDELEKIAGKYGMTVQQTPDGEIMFFPVKDGRPMTTEEIDQLTLEQSAELESHQGELLEAAAKVIREQHEMQRKMSVEVGNVARNFAKKIVGPMIDELRNEFVADEGTSSDSAPADSPTNVQRLSSWLDEIQKHILENLDRFRDPIHHPMAAMMGPDDDEIEEQFLEYRVNLLVDNSDAERAPIVIERAPNFRNLFGTIERIVDRSGRVITNFTRIKSGSLLKANGGYLVLDLMDALAEPFVWKQLKRTLKSGSLDIEVYDPFAMFTVSGLQPESVPLNVRLVAVGEPLTYHLLFLYDDEFREVFRIKADFDDEMKRDEAAGELYGRLARRLSDTEDMLPLNAAAIAVLVREGARVASNRNKLSTLFTHLADVIREADYWARQENADIVSEAHVEQSLNGRIERSDLFAEKIRDLIREGSLLVDVDGKAVGQINALSVADLGDYAFGRPTRMTCSVGIGTAGIVNIERESRLSGRTFDKGLLILEGYLRRTYASDMPLALSASLAMEQSYGGIDGDSASAAELICLLSALTDLPIRQDIAITGSINQMGQIQAIGGVNEKIEGFFDVCKQAGLTGSQGVCIPVANIQHLVLRPDVVAEIHNNRFHVWPVKTIDEALELMLSQPAGTVSESSSIHGQVASRLQQMLKTLSDQRLLSDHRTWTPDKPPELPNDPRPPFPGQETGVVHLPS